MRSLDFNKFRYRPDCFEFILQWDIMFVQQIGIRKFLRISATISNLLRFPSTTLLVLNKLPYLSELPFSYTFFLPLNFSHFSDKAGVSSSVSTMKTIFLWGIVWERAAEPNIERPRLICVWSPWHWIATRLPSCETQTTRLFFLHWGHPTESFILSIPRNTLLSIISVYLFSCLLPFSAIKSHWRLASSTIFHNIRS
jgi:hypothetical protein